MSQSWHESRNKTGEGRVSSRPSSAPATSSPHTTKVCVVSKVVSKSKIQDLIQIKIRSARYAGQLSTRCRCWAVRACNGSSKCWWCCRRRLGCDDSY